MSTCVGCSQEVEVSAAFCPRCGTPNPDAKSIPTRNSDEIAEHIPVDDLRVDLQSALGADFTVERPLGEGGFAIVFLVQDKKLSRRIAVKVLRPELTASHSGVRRFVREAESVASLNHPHILPIFFVGQGKGLVYFGMPLVDGESLDAVLAREGQLAEVEVVRLGSAVADALGEAHANGLVHRDVKPANILLQGSGRRPLVTDFGIAKAAKGADDKLTGTGVVIGSPHYMSPEQAGGSSDIDHRSDIYSLGIMLWQMLAGSLPFDAPDTRSILMQHLTQPLPSLRERRPSVRAELMRVVERCTAKAREDRYQTAAEVAEALRAAATREMTQPPRRRRWVPLVATAVVAVVAVAVGIAVLQSVRRHGPIEPTRSAATAGGSTRITAPVIAVLPFEVAGARDSAEMSRTASRLLTKALATGLGVATVDVNRFLSLWASERHSLAAPLDSNAAFAYQQGANQLVFGSSVQVGTQVRLSVDIYDTRDLASLGQAELTGNPDSLFVLVDRLANDVATVFCKRPAFNPRNLCFDVAARPVQPIVVAYAGHPPSPALKVSVRVTRDGAYADVEPGSTPPDVLAAALPVLAAARFQAARKDGRTVDAWTETEITVRAPEASPAPSTPVPYAGASGAISLGTRPVSTIYVNGIARGSRLNRAEVPAGRVRLTFQVQDSTGMWWAEPREITVRPNTVTVLGYIPLVRPGSVGRLQQP
jgi:serine/threonine protein kinase